MINFNHMDIFTSKTYIDNDRLQSYRLIHIQNIHTLSLLQLKPNSPVITLRSHTLVQWRIHFKNTVIQTNHETPLYLVNQNPPLCIVFIKTWCHYFETLSQCPYHSSKPLNVPTKILIPLLFQYSYKTM